MTQLTIDSMFEVEMDFQTETELDEFLDNLEGIECVYIYNKETKLLTIFSLRRL